ncbi:MAG: CAP domain-containing protein [Acidimicrobiales bacterium]
MTVEHTRRPKLRSAALVALALVAVISTATGCTHRELGGRSQALINSERARRGLPELTWDDSAGQKAQAWAEQLAATKTLSHSRLVDGITGDWTSLGENVGFNNSVDGAHAGFMNSPKHRAAILSGSYSAVGVGVAENDGLVYVVQVFRG